MLRLDASFANLCHFSVLGFNLLATTFVLYLLYWYRIIFCSVFTAWTLNISTSWLEHCSLVSYINKGAFRHLLFFNHSLFLIKFLSFLLLIIETPFTIWIQWSWIRRLIAAKYCNICNDFSHNLITFYFDLVQGPVLFRRIILILSIDTILNLFESIRFVFIVL